MAWTSDDLVASVRRRAQLPDASADGAISDADILALADEEIALRLVPLVREARGDYFVTHEDTTIVSGTARYRVPARAQASGLRDLTIVDPNGNEFSVPQVSSEEMGEIASSGVTFGSRGVVFVMEGPDVVLIPTPTQSGYTLRMRYHRSHGQLIPVSGAGAVFPNDATSFDVADSTLLIYSAESQATIAPFTGIVFDLIYSGPPFGLLAADVTATNVASGGGFFTVTYSSSEPSTVSPDSSLYMAWPGLTPVVNLPRECWPLLVSAATSRVLEVVGDRDAAQLAFALYERESGNVMDLLTPRVEGARKRVIDHFSTLRRGRR